MDRYIPTTITTRSVDESDVYDEDPPIVASAMSPPYHAYEDGVATQSLILNNTCLVPGDLRRMGREIGYPMNTISIKYCYVKHYHRKKVHEPKLLAELLDILHEASPHLVSLKLQGPFPRHTADVKRILTELTADEEERTLTDQNGEIPPPITPALKELVLSVPEDGHIPITSQWRNFTQRNPQLERLRLESFDLTLDEDGDYENPVSSSIVNLADALKQGAGLRDLQLGGCRIHDKGLWELVKNLDYMKRFRVFRIPRCTSLSYISLLTAAYLIQLNSGLEVLDLTGNKSIFANLTPPSTADAIATGTAPQSKQDTQASDNALTQFLRSLQNNSTLVELHLNFCGMNDNTFKFLLCALEKNRKLAVLNLNFNQITRKVGLEEHLVHALPSLKGLLHLSLEGLVRKRNRHHHQRHENDKNNYGHSNGGEDDVAEATTVSSLHSWEKRFLEALDENSSLGSLTLDEDIFHNNTVMFREIQHRLERNLEWQRDQKFEHRQRHSPQSNGNELSSRLM